jgi:hypothetical protein
VPAPPAFDDPSFDDGGVAVAHVAVYVATDLVG